MLRWLTAGESHGPELVAVLDGMPAGVRVGIDEIRTELARRRSGYGRGARMRFEADAVSIVGGIRHGVTTGGPIAIRIGNSEWDRWRVVMDPSPVSRAELLRDGAGSGEKLTGRAAPLTRPRPGHADLVGMQKYGHADARDVLERASARETAARVALGVVAQAFLTQAAGVSAACATAAIGGVHLPAGGRWREAPWSVDQALLDADPVRCPDEQASRDMVAAIDAARGAGDTLGGVVEACVWGVPPGLGTYAQADRRIDAALAGAVMSIPAIKGVEIGDGFVVADLPGSRAHDDIYPSPEGPVRQTNRSGGTEGGMTTGQVLRVRAAMKPISTVPSGTATLDVQTGEAARAHPQRSDACAVPAAGLVVLGMTRLVVAQALLDKFGGDHADHTKAAVRHYLDGLPEHLRHVPVGPGETGQMGENDE